MTSMPASRSARAMTLAPRSWPSRPGFAMTTLSFFAMMCHGVGSRFPAGAENGSRPLDDRDFLVFAPDFAQGVAHFADRRVGAHCLENRRHQVLAGPRRGPEPVERARDGAVVAARLQRLEPGDLLL